MSVKSQIIGNTKEVASVVNHNDSGNGLLCYTHPYDHYQYGVNFLSNPTYGKALNQNPTQETIVSTLVHDGEDTPAWTAANFSGNGFDFNSTEEAHTGSRSVDGTNATNNETASFTSPVAVNVSGISYFRFFIFITSFSTSGTKDIIISAYDAGLLASTELSIKNYTDTTLFDTWQQVDIPVADFQFTSATFDSIRFRVVDISRGSPPNFYLDDMELISVTGGDQVFEYTWRPEYDEEYYLTSLRFASLTTGKTDLDSSLFFGIPALTTGIELVLRDRNEVFMALDARDLFDIISWGDVYLGADGSNNNVTILCEFRIPMGHFKVSGKTGQYLSLRVRDDLSTITRFTCAVTTAKVIKG